MATWGLVATVKAPEEKVLAFVAYHLSLGASRIWIYFDDPDDHAYDTVARIPGVTATVCNAAYYADKTRHDRHQNRQARNARDAYEHCTTEWLGHIDVDEFLLPNAPLDQILDAVPAEQGVLKLEPFEAMHDPFLTDDIYTAIAFRGPLRAGNARLRPLVLGQYAEIIPDGMLSHAVGKVMFRAGIRNLSPRLHSVMLHGLRLLAPDFCPDVRLLHFHAQDREAWLAALPFRLTRGAYQYRPELQAYLLAADDAEIGRFYDETQTVKLKLIDWLQGAGRLLLAELDLRRKVQSMMEQL